MTCICRADHFRLGTVPIFAQRKWDCRLKNENGLIPFCRVPFQPELSLTAQNTLGHPPGPFTLSEEKARLKIDDQLAQCG